MRLFNERRPLHVHCLSGKECFQGLVYVSLSANYPFGVLFTQNWLFGFNRSWCQFLYIAFRCTFQRKLTMRLFLLFMVSRRHKRLLISKTIVSSSVKVIFICFLLLRKLVINYEWWMQEFILILLKACCGLIVNQRRDFWLYKYSSPFDNWLIIDVLTSIILSGSVKPWINFGTSDSFKILQIGPMIYWRSGGSIVQSVHFFDAGTKHMLHYYYLFKLPKQVNF